jgi:hypothetical protein
MLAERLPAAVLAVYASWTSACPKAGSMAPAAGGKAVTGRYAYVRYHR